MPESELLKDITPDRNLHYQNVNASCLPIVIAGGGCVGLFLSLLLAHSPIPNRIIVVEPSRPDPNATRAMAHQPPTYPILSRVPGLLPELFKAGSLSSGICFRTSVAHGSRVIAGKEFENAGNRIQGKGQLLLPQGKFQEVLMRMLEMDGGRVEMRAGWKVLGVINRSTSVTVRVENELGVQDDIDATYLVGADGAHSLIRKLLNIEFQGETLDAQLIAADLYFDFHAHGFYDANFVLDPEDYGLIGRIGKSLETEKDGPPLWRVSYGMPLAVTEEEIQRTIDEKLSKMLPNRGLDKDGKKAYEVVRVAPYKAQQRIASTLYTKRVMLVGDSAHLTNPYAGLGLASGIADASSLAEVLERILTVEVTDPDILLDAWSDARRQKFLEVVDKPSRMAYKRVKSDVSSEEKLEVLMTGDPLIAALKKGMPVMTASLETQGKGLMGW